MEEITIEPQKKYTKVGGWLMLFCISLIVISPARTLISLVTSYNQLKDYFSLYGGLQIIFVADLIMSSIVNVLGILAGIALWNIKPDAVKTAKNYLLITLGYLVFAAFLPFVVGLPAAFNEAMIPEVAKTSIQGLLGVGIWYWYLSVSKRVKETYVTPELNNTSGSLDADLEAYIPQSETTVTPVIKCTYCGYEKASEEEFCRACHRNNEGILLRDAKNNLG